MSVVMSPCPVVRCPDSILLSRHVTPHGGLRWDSHRGSTNTWNFGTLVRMVSECCIVVSCHWRAGLNEPLIYCSSFFSLYDQVPKITPPSPPIFFTCSFPAVCAVVVQISDCACSKWCLVRLLKSLVRLIIDNKDNRILTYVRSYSFNDVAIIPEGRTLISAWDHLLQGKYL